MVTKFFADNKVKVMPWPPYSPDVNPIENLWGDLKRKVNARSPNSVESLVRIAKEEWKKITVDKALLERLVESMPRRLAAVIKSEGGATRY